MPESSAQQKQGEKSGKIFDLSDWWCIFFYYMLAYFLAEALDLEPILDGSLKDILKPMH